MLGSQLYTLFANPEKTEQLIQEGINKAESGVGTTWLDEAEEVFEEFVRDNPDKEFLTAQVNHWARTERGFESLPGGKAWGGVVRRLRNRGLIVEVRKVQSPHAHGSYVSVWRAVGN